MINVRDLKKSELKFAKSLTDQEDWSNSTEDWNRLFRISIPLVAYDGDNLLGIATPFDYGVLGMIGNVVVSSNHRGSLTKVAHIPMPINFGF